MKSLERRVRDLERFVSPLCYVAVRGPDGKLYPRQPGAVLAPVVAVIPAPLTLEEWKASVQEAIGEHALPHRRGYRID